MADLIYNGVDLSAMKTLGYHAEPVYDKAGLTVLFQKITIHVSSVLHPKWMATGKTPVIQPGGNLGVDGDRMALSLAKLNELLGTPCRQLVFRVGSDTVIVSPPSLPDGTSEDCDCNHGPKTKVFEVSEIIGDRSAFVSMRIETWINNNEFFCLSNTWATQCVTDEAGYTTRTVRGCAVFRADFLRRADLTADSFRPFLIVPTRNPLQRRQVNCQLSEDGTTLDYVVEDSEVTYGMGKNSEVQKIECNATSGAHTDITSMKKAIEVIGGGIGSSIASGGIDILTPIKGIWNHAVPEGRATCMVRVYGRRNSRKENLARVALAVGVDRFGPLTLLNAVIIVGAHLTQLAGSGDAPMVELRLEFLMTHLLLTFLIDPPSIFRVMNLATEIDPVGELKYTQISDSPDIGGSNNTRGSFVQSLVIQALGGYGFLPEVPAESDDKPDADQYG